MKIPSERILLLRKAQLYRFFALVFAALGLAVFLSLYFTQVEGTFFSSLRNPFIVTIIIVPFLPAVVLSLKARKYEKQLNLNADAKNAGSE